MNIYLKGLSVVLLMFVVNRFSDRKLIMAVIPLF